MIWYSSVEVDVSHGVVLISDLQSSALIYKTSAQQEFDVR